VFFPRCLSSPYFSLSLSLSLSLHSFLVNRDSPASIKSSFTSAWYIRRPRAENLGTRLPVFFWLLSSNSLRRRHREGKWSSEIGWKRKRRRKTKKVFTTFGPVTFQRCESRLRRDTCFYRLLSPFTRILILKAYHCT